MRKNSKTAQNHQAKFGVEHRKNFSDTSSMLLADRFPIAKLRTNEDFQVAFYQERNLEEIETFFMHGGCFHPRVQRLITDSEDLAVLKLFLRFWEFSPIEREHMLKRSSLDFIELYMSKKSLGQKSIEIIKNKRFDKSFIEKHWRELNSKAQKACLGIRHFTFLEKVK